jgi:hypothetical protein
MRAKLIAFAFSGFATFLHPVISTADEAVERVGLELVLLADGSSSINAEEIYFQRRGYAAAITHPDVLTAIRSSFRKKIAVTYIEWGKEDQQGVVVPWSIIDGPGSAAAFAELLLSRPRMAIGYNAIGTALTVARAHIEYNEYSAPRMVIDISLDSVKSWDDIPTSEARDSAVADGIVINGLAVLCRLCGGRPTDRGLEIDMVDQIIGGFGSFVVVADETLSFADAVRKKLVHEIAGLPLPAKPATLAASSPEQ